MKRLQDFPVAWIGLAAALGFAIVYTAMSPAAASAVRGALGRWRGV